MTTTTPSPAPPLTSGPFAAQYTADRRFSAASEEPLSEERCEPTNAILPGGIPPLPPHAKLIAADDMCKVSVP